MLDVRCLTDIHLGATGGQSSACRRAADFRRSSLDAELAGRLQADTATRDLDRIIPSDLDAFAAELQLSVYLDGDLVGLGVDRYQVLAGFIDDADAGSIVRIINGDHMA